MRPGSVNAWLATLQPGEYHYIEVPIKGYAQMMRKLNPGMQRRPPELRRYQFRTSLHTAIANGDPAEVRYLVKVERLQ